MTQVNRSMMPYDDVYRGIKFNSVLVDDCHPLLVAAAPLCPWHSSTDNEPPFPTFLPNLAARDHRSNRYSLLPISTRVSRITEIT